MEPCPVSGNGRVVSGGYEAASCHRSRLYGLGLGVSIARAMRPNLLKTSVKRCSLGPR